MKYSMKVGNGPMNIEQVMLTIRITVCIQGLLHDSIQLGDRESLTALQS